MNIFRFLLLSTFLLPLPSLSAAAGQNLASHPYWLALGHYRQAGVLIKHYESDVQDENFFLSPQGNRDPSAELQATLDAVTQPDAVCRFPARYHWLNEQLQDKAFSGLYLQRLAGCDEYLKWRKLINAHSAALIYASTHLNSPSSMYGHTLLRIDPADLEKKGTTLLSYGVSFAANIPPEDNSIIYAFNGIFGGYPGLFSVMPYYEKLREYSHMENRDVWEYKLNLSPEEMDRMMMHVWELQDMKFRYFFFDENCSYRLLELLDIARPGQNIMAGYVYAAIPVDTVRGAKKNGFVDQVDFRPSISSSLKSKIATLAPAEQEMALRLSQDTALLESVEYQSLPAERRAGVSVVAYDYLRYQVRKSLRDETIARNSFRLLQEINSLPVTRFPEPSVPAQPELGHESAAVTVTAGREDSSNYLDAEFRMSFHELEDNIEGYLPGSAINMGRFKFRQYEDEQQQLQHFDVIDIDSLSPRDDFFKPVSWRSSVGFERYRTADRDQGVIQANAGGGFTWEVSNNTLFYILGTGRAEYNEGFVNNWQAAAGLASGVLYISPSVTVHAGFDGHEFFNGYQRARSFATLHVPLAKDSAIEASISHHHHSDIEFDRAELSWRYHF